jgi:type IV pilus assembly protein PilW
MNQLSRPPLPPTSTQHKARGFSLIELMIAIVIGLFITLGLSQMFLSMYSNASTQRGLAAFQDNQRLALTVLANNLDLAGYYTGTGTVTAATSPLVATKNADNSTFTLGAGLVGTDAASNGTSNDTINVQYQSGGNTVDDIINCQGGAATGATTAATFINSFSVNSSNQLVCTVTTNGGTPSSALVIASNVASMSILYGMINPATNSIGSYLTADQVNSVAALGNGSGWNTVCSVQVTLVLTNPVSNTNTTWIQTINTLHSS